MDTLAAVGDVELRRTFSFVRGQARPVTADDVARALGVPRSAARWRLEKLAAADALRVGFERRTGRRGPGAGRPAKTYAPAPETRAIEFPRRRYETLVGLLAHVLPRRGFDRRLAEVGAAYARELAAAMRLRPAAAIAVGVERLCRGLRRLGFHVQVEELSSAGARLACMTCPLRPVVIAHPEAAALDAGMWRGLVTAATRQEVVVSTRDCLDGDTSCRIFVRFR